MFQKTALYVAMAFLGGWGGMSIAAGAEKSPYISVDELQPGMKGYGLTVFQGVEPERFDVVVVSVMRNYNAGRDAFIIRCLDERFDVARGVQGCSGSPVYFDGRLAGAMSFGWPYGVEPLYGVTPIDQMLEVADAAHDKLQGAQLNRRASLDRSMYASLMAGDLMDDQQVRQFVRRSRLSRSRDETGEMTSLGPLLLVSGMDAETLNDMQQWMGPLRMSAVAGGGNSTDSGTKAEIKPGSTLTIPVMMGDINGSVLGTVTEVIGDKVYGFGHAWNGEGAVVWPLATGCIHTFISRSSMSFKLGDAIDIVGAIRADESTAIFGTMGEAPPMIPITVEVAWPYRNDTRTFNMQVAVDEIETPMFAASVISGAINQKGGLPRYHTMRYEGQLKFAGYEPMTFTGVDTANGARGLAREILSIAAYMLGNPWQSVQLESIQIKAVVEEGDTQAAFRDVRLNRMSFEPGDTVRATIELEPLRDKIQTVELLLTLPEDLPDGLYPLMITSSDGYRDLLSKAQSYKYRPENMQDLHRILCERLTYRDDRLYMCLIHPRQGVSLRDEGFLHLPSSRAMLLTDGRREIPTASISELITSQIQTVYIPVGQSEFEIKVERRLK